MAAQKLPNKAEAICHQFQGNVGQADNREAASAATWATAAKGSAMALQLNAVCFCRLKQCFRNSSLLCGRRHMLQLAFLRNYAIDMQRCLAA